MGNSFGEFRDGKWGYYADHDRAMEVKREQQRQKVQEREDHRRNALVRAGTGRGKTARRGGTA